MGNSEGQSHIDAFVRWAKARAWISDRVVRDSIVFCDGGVDLRHTCTWSGTKREILVHLSTTDSRRRELDTPIPANRCDPWVVDQSELARETLQVVSCPTCLGAKKVGCGRCGGTASTKCDFCLGSGRGVSEKTGRPVNCKRCRGRGVRKCGGCTGGLAKCSTCAAKGKVERWLEVSESVVKVERADVSLWREAERGGLAVDLDSHWPEEPEYEWEGEPNDLPPTEEVGVLLTSLSVSELPSGTRLSGVKLTRHRRPVSLIRYKFLGVDAPVAFVGEEGLCAEYPDSRRPLRLRRILIAITCLIGAAIGTVFTYKFNGVHEFVRSSGAVPKFALAMFVGAVLLALPAAGLVSRGGRLLRTVLSGIPVAAAAVFGMHTWMIAMPSLERAESSYAANRAQEASAELRAYVSLNGRSPEASDLEARLRFDKAKLEADPRSMLAEAKKQNVDRRRELERLALKRCRRVDFRDLPRDLEFDDQEFSAKYQALLIAGYSERVRQLQGDRQLTASRYALEQMSKRFSALPEVQQLRSNQVRLEGLTCARVFDLDCVDRSVATLKNLVGEQTQASVRKQYEEAALAEIARRRAVFEAEKDPKAGLRQLDGLTSASKFLENYKIQDAAGLKKWTRGKRRIMLRKIKKLRAAEARRKKQEAARRKIEERQRAADERRRIAAEKRAEQRRRRANARARCCDGTLSPTCGCGRTRGCCSHHGGVCGCAY